MVSALFPKFAMKNTPHYFCNDLTRQIVVRVDCKNLLLFCLLGFFVPTRYLFHLLISLGLFTPCFICGVYMFKQSFFLNPRKGQIACRLGQCKLYNVQCTILNTYKSKYRNLTVKLIFEKVCRIYRYM